MFPLRRRERTRFRAHGRAVVDAQRERRARLALPSYTKKYRHLLLGLPGCPTRWPPSRAIQRIFASGKARRKPSSSTVIEERISLGLTRPVLRMMSRVPMPTVAKLSIEGLKQFRASGGSPSTHLRPLVRVGSLSDEEGRPHESAPPLTVIASPSRGVRRNAAQTPIDSPANST